VAKIPCLSGRRCRLMLDRPRIMGVLNLTPDSFYDGGLHQDQDAALHRVAEMVAEGADLIDIGAESTRPGAAQVSEGEEIDRVAGIIERLVKEFAVPLSIDTSKSAVARASVAAGVEFINDISGLNFDPAMAGVAASSGAGLFLMHTRGRPDQMQQDTVYVDLLEEVESALRCSAQQALQAGVTQEKIALDPGIGFGKDLAGNLLLLNRLDRLCNLGFPLLLGTSRKSFIGKVLDQENPAERLNGSLATVALGVDRGAMLFRVHDVKPALEVARMAWAIKTAA
jgi:dihydropteroate synthase